MVEESNEQVQAEGENPPPSEEGGVVNENGASNGGGEDVPTDTPPTEELPEVREGEVESSSNDEPEEPGMWEETFKSHHDSKPYGMCVCVCVCVCACGEGVIVNFAMVTVTDEYYLAIVCTCMYIFVIVPFSCVDEYCVVVFPLYIVTWG